MTFEKNNNNYSVLVETQNCSGCGMQGEKVLQGHRTAQGSTKAQRCSNCQNS